MNKATILLVLIRSMTKAEKRFLKLYSNLQDGDKVYLRLFDLMKEWLLRRGNSPEIRPRGRKMQLRNRGQTPL